MEDIPRLLVFNYMRIESITRVFWDDRVNNTEVDHSVLIKDIKSIGEVGDFHLLRWLRHVLRISSHCLPRQTTLFGGVG